MDGNSEMRGGSPITPEELFDHTATLAGLTFTQIQDAAALRDELKRVADALKKSAEQNQITTRQAIAELKQQYSPEAIRQMVEASREATAGYKQVVEESTQAHRDSVAEQRKLNRDLAQENDKVFWKRTVGAAMVGLVATGVGVALVGWKVPSLDEVNRREQIAEDAARKLHLEQGIVDHDGEHWVPILQSFKNCDPQGSNNCTVYGRLD